MIHSLQFNAILVEFSNIDQRVAIGWEQIALDSDITYSTDFTSTKNRIRNVREIQQILQIQNIVLKRGFNIYRRFASWIACLLIKVFLQHRIRPDLSCLMNCAPSMMYPSVIYAILEFWKNMSTSLNITLMLSRTLQGLFSLPLSKLFL